MKRAAMTAAMAAAVSAAAQQRAAPPPGIAAGQEVRVPTAFQSQSAGNLGGGAAPAGPGGNPYAWRAPIPTSFKTRQTGATVSAPRVGVQQAVVVRAGSRIVYRARFFDGTEADFADGLVTGVHGRRYLGLGRRAGCYMVRDLQSGEIARFALSAR